MKKLYENNLDCIRALLDCNLFCYYLFRGGFILPRLLSSALSSFLRLRSLRLQRWMWDVGYKLKASLLVDMPNYTSSMDHPISFKIFACVHACAKSCFEPVNECYYLSYTLVIKVWYWDYVVVLLQVN